MQSQLFLGVPITESLQSFLVDKDAERLRLFFSNPLYFQRVTLDSREFLGKILDERIAFSDLDSFEANLLSILNKAFPVSLQIPEIQIFPYAF